nr:immunoglobulin light chain junction region [Macaca mulatta]MOX47822.1 immunoglobulin light chain junction region [Macaca mulatta]MOX47943.1 immunoglobulin light chain junction region [Macaca mulatta]MOX47994.1 immunoglobulin light chain junction region [Macaca mulatta]MOX48043.1 immunoglobulin light chain junction region [Macaca mulatta]
CQQHNSFPPTF